MTDPPRARTAIVTVALVIVAVLVIGYVFGAWRSMPTLAEQEAENRAAAERIRVSAKRSCDMGREADCVRLYDEAKRFDPEGDLAPEVQEDRRTAREALASDAAPSAHP